MMLKGSIIFALLFVLSYVFVVETTKEPSQVSKHESISKEQKAPQIKFPEQQDTKLKKNRPEKKKQPQKLIGKTSDKPKKSELSKKGYLDLSLTLALDWLASIQEENGSWLNEKYGGEYLNPITTTAIALLPFLELEKTIHRERYQKTIQEGLLFLKNQLGQKIESHQQSQKNFGHNYESAIVLLALSKGLLRYKNWIDREHANYIAKLFLDSHQAREVGWTYFLGPSNDQGDLSVSSWIIYALVKGALVDLDYHESEDAQRVFNAYLNWLNHSLINAVLGTASYRIGEKGSRNMTWMAIIQKKLLEDAYESPFIDNAYKLSDTKQWMEQLIHDGKIVDAYGIFFGNWAASYRSESEWGTWKDDIHEDLMKIQIKNKKDKNFGSWNPGQDQSSQKGGRIWVTSLMALALQWKHGTIFDEEEYVQEVERDSTLEWLAKNQEPDGSWDSRKHGGQGLSKLATTSFAILPFLTAGHSENIGYYKKKVRAGVRYLNKEITSMREKSYEGQAQYNDPLGLSVCLVTLSEARLFGSKKITKTNAEWICKQLILLGENDHHAWQFINQDPPGTPRGFLATFAILGLKSARAAGLKSIKNENATRVFKQYKQWIHHHVADGETGLYKGEALYHDSKYSSWSLVFNKMCLGYPRKDPFISKVTDMSLKNKWHHDLLLEDQVLDAYGVYIGAMVSFQTQGQSWKTWHKEIYRKVQKLRLGKKHKELKGTWTLGNDYLSIQGGRVVMSSVLYLSSFFYYRAYEIVR